MYQLEKKKQKTISSQEKTTRRILNAAKEDLRLKELPVHIECFDNSNIQGAIPVAACAVFINGKPSKKEYRHFNIKTVSGPNDYASMEEIIYRRYKRMLDEKKSLPQLIIIDGGKGQLNAAVNSLEKLNIRGKMAVIGIAKKLEEIFFPGDSVPLYINKNSETLKLIQQLRNEAHRFSIHFHRQKRMKSMSASELDHIKGIGEKTKEDLLKRFGSIKKIKEADTEEIIQLIGNKRTQMLLSGLNKA